MRVRVRGPEGTSTVTLEEAATVNDLRAQIKSVTGLSAFDLKIGYPPQPLDLDQFDGDSKLADTGLKLNGEQLLASERDVASSLKSPLNDPPSVPAPISTSAKSQSAHSTQPPVLSPRTNQSKSADHDPPEIPVLSSNGTLVLRVMPDDNSCLFRALAYAVLPQVDSTFELRSIVASTIQSSPEIYSAAVLEKRPDDYCRWIMRDDAWGGAIELGILSQHFDIEICSINVQDLRVDRFNEGVAKRCILVYSGIHYDTIALNKSSPPYEQANAPQEYDHRVFDNDDEAIINGAILLCGKLQKQHYYTDTAGFTVRCGDCGWEGNGEKAAIKHAQQTGHYNMQEAE